jgi:surface antigen
VGGTVFAAIATFRDGSDQLCREFEYGRDGGDTVVAVACHADETWSVRFAVATAAAGGTGYVPASSLDALDGWLAAVEAGAPLSNDEEAAALADLR